MTQPESHSTRPARTASIILLLLCLGAAGFLFALRPASGRLVVYCAHDAIYAQEVLDAFTRETGIEVTRRFDTEATKSLGLIQQIIAEKGNPRCDVFWNNQVLGTVQLQQAGVLEPYQGSGYARIPDRYKDPDGHWAGFGGRLRVFILNKDKLAADLTEEQFAELVQGDLQHVAIAKPLYGTTLSHYSVIHDLEGEAALRAWHADIRERGVREVQGNAMVKNLVAQGVCDWGWTDTDDFFVALDAGDPVTMLPVRCKDQSTICIPNSVAIIRGTKKRSDAERLVDYLLSAETELTLARSRSRQIPLGEVDADAIPEDVRPLAEWAKDGYNILQAVGAREATLEWLSQEYLE